MPLTESQKRYYDRLASERQANTPTISRGLGKYERKIPKQSIGMHIVRSIDRGADKIYSLLPKQVGQVFAMSPMGMLYNGAHKAVNDFVSPEAAEVVDAVMNVTALRKPGVKVGKGVYKTGKFANYIRKGSENADLKKLYEIANHNAYLSKTDNPWVKQWRDKGYSTSTITRYSRRKAHSHYNKSVDNYTKAFDMIANSPIVYNNPIIKRAVETAMRTGSSSSPMSIIKNNIKEISKERKIAVQNSALQLVDNIVNPIVVRTPFTYNKKMPIVKPKDDILAKPIEIDYDNIVSEPIKTPTNIKIKTKVKATKPVKGMDFDVDENLPFKFGGQTFKSRF